MHQGQSREQFRNNNAKLSAHAAWHLRTEGASSSMLRPSLLALLVSAAVAVMAVSPGTALAQSPAAPEARQSFSIPAQPLLNGLKAFGRQTQLQVLFDDALVNGFQGAAVSGSFSPTDALKHLLAGTGLVAVSTQAGTFTIRAQPVAASTTTLAAVTVTAQADRNDITSEGTGTYAARGASIMKGAQSLKDIPQSVSVITRQRMEDQNLTSMEDVLMQTTGLSKNIYGQGNNYFSARGFEMRNSQVDGLSKFDANSGSFFQPDMAMYDRVEVLRGAAGLLLGNGAPGGTINYVRKRPLSENQFSVGLQAGSWNNYRTEFDASRVLNEDKSLRGRFVASWQDRDYFYDKTHTRQPFFYGVVDYDFSPQTQAIVGVRYQEKKEDGARWAGGLPVSSDGSDLKLPRSTSFGAPWAYSQAKTKEAFAEIKHEINSQWNIKLSANYQKVDQSSYELGLDGSIDPVSGAGATWTPQSYDGVTTAKAFGATLNGSFDVFGRRQKVSIGLNDERLSDVGDEGYHFRDRVSFDLSNPYASAGSKPVTTAGHSAMEVTNRSVYGNLHLQVADPLRLVLGGRMSWYSYNYNYQYGASLTSYKQNREFTPYAGVLLDLNRDWTAYASYADIFQPQSNYFTASGKPLEPAIGANYELGLKGDLFGGRATASMAFFYIRQNNRALVDPSYPNNCPGSPSSRACYINAGEVESKGFEAEINGEVARGLQVWAGYTFNRQVYLKDRDSSGNATESEGRNFSAYTPKHILRAGGSYRLNGALSNLTLGGNVSVQSDTSVTSGSVVRAQSGYAVWGAFARYQVNKQWVVGVNVNNLFDRVYYLSPNRTYYGTPREIVVTAKATF